MSGYLVVQSADLEKLVEEVNDKMAFNVHSTITYQPIGGVSVHVIKVIQAIGIEYEQVIYTQAMVTRVK